MKVKISLDRHATVPVPIARVRHLLEDVPATIRLFPRLRALTEVGREVYLWQMEPIGSRLAGIAHEVSYAARFDVDLGRAVVEWQPVQGHGNALIGGRWLLRADGQSTQMRIVVAGELHDVPVPLLARPMAQPFVQAKFVGLVDRYLERLAAAVEAPLGQRRPAAAAGPARAARRKA